MLSKRKNGYIAENAEPHYI